MTGERRQPRYGVVWRARLRCREWREAYRVATANVSRGGAFFATERTPGVGVRVEVALELPDATVLTLSGDCVHVRTLEQARAQKLPPGFGMRFDQASAGDLARLEELAEHAGVPLEVRDDERQRSRDEPQPGAAATALPEAPAVQLRRTRR